MASGIRRSAGLATVTLAGLLAMGLGATPASAQQDANGAQALRIFLDCNRCDRDYLRIEITNYVRDRRDAQVHVLITTERTGGGGTAYTLDFVGLEEFTGIDRPAHLLHHSRRYRR